MRLAALPGPVTEALCWAHARRKLFVLADIAAKAKKGKQRAIISPLAFEAVKRIDALLHALFRPGDNVKKSFAL
jgi:hypothetical protein